MDMSFQTCTTFFFQQNAKEDILKNTGVQTTLTFIVWTKKKKKKKKFRQSFKTM